MLGHLDPGARVRVVNWTNSAPALGTLRYEMGRHPDDHRLARLVEELRGADPDVEQWWDDQASTALVVGDT